MINKIEAYLKDYFIVLTFDEIMTLRSIADKIVNDESLNAEDRQILKDYKILN